jgi:sortase (surface protein transpeptidase)
MNTNKLKSKTTVKPSKKVAEKVSKNSKVAKKSVVQAPKNNNGKFFLTIAMLFIVAGTLLAFPTLMRVWHERQHIATAPAPAPARTPAVVAATKADETIQGKPSRLVIPSLNIDVKIADGIYNATTQTWTLSKDKAHYALMTPEPNNQSGNTFIYGHNRSEVFSRLSKLAIGQDAVIYTDNGHVFTYKYRSAYETDPNDSSLFTYTGAPILTLQTCSGVWYQNRFLMTFDLVEAA